MNIHGFEIEWLDYQTGNKGQLRETTLFYKIDGKKTEKKVWGNQSVSEDLMKRKVTRELELKREIQDADEEE